jgi:hypothetical protein
VRGGLQIPQFWRGSLPYGSLTMPDSVQGARPRRRYEASFSSKLLATIDPDMPVINSIVLRHLKLRLPAHIASQRAKCIVELHGGLVTCFTEFLTTETGRYVG